MDILYLLIPLSAVLVLAILGVFAWALHGGQFDDLDAVGEGILELDSDSLDRNQVDGARAPEQFAPSELERLDGSKHANNV
jgi:cbb3-type cytochrome oxidase maturation protein